MKNTKYKIESEIRNLRSEINKGFSLIELVFTVFFLSVIIVGAVNLQTSGLRMGNSRSNEVEAHFLANQGAEVVEGLGTVGIAAQCSAPSCTCQITNFGIYNIDCMTVPEAIDTTFSRTIEISSGSLTNAYEITSIVEWEDSSGTHTAEAKRIIFN
ncbi:hypothetical protein KKA95_03300 [Patescibacteria group bacterium]|nr:hypothetical protein [Patescibacteria group bacterium]